MNQQPGKKAHEKFRHQGVNVERHDGVQHRRDEKEFRYGKACSQQQDREPCRDHHEQCIENIVRGDHPRAMGRLAAALDERIERHAVEPAEHGEQREVGHHPPMRGIG